jgi:hypothetical protein
MLLLTLILITYTCIANVRPVSDAGVHIQLKKGEKDMINFNGAASYDPDNQPWDHLRYYWKFYRSQPTSHPKFDLSRYNVSHSVIWNVSIKELPIGVHSFILYVSDGQSIDWSIFNLTIT